MSFMILKRSSMYSIQFRIYFYFLRSIIIIVNISYEPRDELRLIFTHRKINDSKSFGREIPYFSLDKIFLNEITKRRDICRRHF